MLWTLDKTCQQFTIDRPTMLRWIRDGIIPMPRILDGFVRFAEVDLDEWIRNGCPASDPDPVLFNKVRARDLLERVNTLGMRLADAERDDDPPDIADRSRRLRHRAAGITEQVRENERTATRGRRAVMARAAEAQAELQGNEDNG